MNIGIGVEAKGQLTELSLKADNEEERRFLFDLKRKLLDESENVEFVGKEES